MDSLCQTGSRSENLLEISSENSSRNSLKIIEIHPENLLEIHPRNVLEIPPLVFPAIYSKWYFFSNFSRNSWGEFSRKYIGNSRRSVNFLRDFSWDSFMIYFSRSSRNSFKDSYRSSYRNSFSNLSRYSSICFVRNSFRILSKDTSSNWLQ